MVGTMLIVIAVTWITINSYVQRHNAQPFSHGMSHCGGDNLDIRCEWALAPSAARISFALGTLIIACGLIRFAYHWAIKKNRQ